MFIAPKDRVLQSTESQDLTLGGRSFFSRHPVTSSFASTFAISWLGAFVVAVPHLLPRESLPKAGIALTGIVDGQAGFRKPGQKCFDLRDMPLRSGWLL